MGIAKLNREKKAKFKGLNMPPSNFSDKTEIEEVRNFWEKALNRLTSSKPDFDSLIAVVKDYLEEPWRG